RRAPPEKRARSGAFGWRVRAEPRAGAPSRTCPAPLLNAGRDRPAMPVRFDLRRSDVEAGMHQIDMLEVDQPRPVYVDAHAVAGGHDPLRLAQGHERSLEIFRPLRGGEMRIHRGIVVEAGIAQAASGKFAAEKGLDLLR